MSRFIRNEQGFAYIMVFMILIIVSASVVAISAGLRTQTNVSALSQNSYVALAEAEKGIAVGYNDLKVNGATTAKNFTITDGSWTITVDYDPGTPNGALKSTAQSGRYSRTVQLNVSTSTTTGLMNSYGMACGGTLSFSNGAYDFKGVPIFGHNINIWQNGVPGNSGAATTLSTDASTINLFDSSGNPLTNVWQVKGINDSLTNSKITQLTGAPNFSIPDVNWNSFTPNYVVNNGNPINADFDLSTDLHNYIQAQLKTNKNFTFQGKVIVIQVSGGTPNITLDGSKLWGNDMAAIGGTIVVKKVGTAVGNSSVVPTFTIQNGSWGSSKDPLHLSTYIDGNFVLKNGLCTDGNFYVSGTSSVTNGAYNFRGGFMSKGNITGVNGFDMSSMNVNWDPKYFILPSSITKSSWAEVDH